MNSITKMLIQFEKFMGNVKFAVLIILIFAIYLIVGTFYESYYGTDYANRAIYKSPLFMLTQLLMFLSIFLATLHRFPYKKRLSGFYVLHAGLLLLFIGSFVTYMSGVDGNLTLPSNIPRSEVTLNEDQVEMQFGTKLDKEIFYLPYTQKAVDLDVNVRGIQLLKYYPFADMQVQWVVDQSGRFKVQSTEYLLRNENISQNFTMSLHPAADEEFAPTKQLGPLFISYMPKEMAPCFNDIKLKFILWNAQEQRCYKAEQLSAKISKTDSQKEFIVLQSPKGKKNIAFIPSQGPLPIDLSTGSSDQLSPFRLFSLEIFEQRPNLFALGNFVAYYQEDQQQWIAKEIIDKKELELPWMNFKISILRHENLSYPISVPSPVRPIQDNNELIQGNHKAILIALNGEKKWITDSKPLKTFFNGQEIGIGLNKKSVQLPFELNLDRFKMDTDPGTNNPASYESFVTLFDGNKSEKHHVFMNNPLKYHRLTFYQASYFQDQSGAFGSVLSVNYDPGRWLKYLGSLLLVLGSFWHFVLRNKLQKIRKTT